MEQLYLFTGIEPEKKEDVNKCQMEDCNSEAEAHRRIRCFKGQTMSSYGSFCIPCVRKLNKELEKDDNKVEVDFYRCGNTASITNVKIGE